MAITTKSAEQLEIGDVTLPLEEIDETDPDFDATADWAEVRGIEIRAGKVHLALQTLHGGFLFGETIDVGDGVGVRESD